MAPTPPGTPARTEPSESAEPSDSAEPSGPKHARLRAELARWITEELSPGDRLPGERRLVERHRVSRITVRHAIAELVSEGLLVREQGRGTFVGSGPARSRLHLASFHEDMATAGLVPSTRPVLVAEQEAPTAAAAHLGAAQALRVRRLRLGDGVPVSLDDCWVPAGLLPPEADWTGSLYAMLRAAGAGITRAEQTVQASGAAPEDAQLLGIAPGAPVLVFHRRSFSAVAADRASVGAAAGGAPAGRAPDGSAPVERPVEYSISVYRGDRYQLSMEVLG